jgi:hypothetical protein
MQNIILGFTMRALLKVLRQKQRVGETVPQLQSF